jgi:hypothetical protein
MIKRIHVNMHVIRRNRRDSRTDPPLTVKTSRGNHKAVRVVISGPSEVIYRPEQPLACGARVWIETDAPLTLEAEAGVTELP